MGTVVFGMSKLRMSMDTRMSKLRKCEVQDPNVGNIQVASPQVADPPLGDPKIADPQDEDP